MITATISNPSSTTGWNASITLEGAANPIQIISVPSNGGNLSFTNLGSGNYFLRLYNGIHTINYNNGTPVNLTSSYVTMSATATTTAPTCSGGTNGTTTIHLPSGGNAPFIYTIQSIQGQQSATTSSRTHTFSGVQSGETISYTIQDGCGAIITSSVVSATVHKPNLNFTLRGIHFFRDGANCSTPRMYVNLSGATINTITNRLTTLQQPGNAMVTINGSNYNLTYVGMIGSDHRFTYDPTSVSGPALIHGTNLTVRFIDECGNVLSSGAAVRMSDQFLNVGSSRVVDPTTCAVSYRILIFGDEDNVNGGGTNTISRNIFFLPTNTVTIEKQDAVNPSVFTEVYRGSLSVTDIQTTTIPSASVTSTVTDPGTYRIKATDACHSTTNTITISENNLSAVNATVTGSVLQGTIGIHLNNTSGVSFPLTVKIERNDGQSNMTINPNAPFNLAGAYNLTFPITYTFNSGLTTSIVDLPPGDYKLTLTDHCSAASGMTKIIHTTSNLTFVPADYQFTLNGTSFRTYIATSEACQSNNSISFFHSRNNSTWRPTTVELRNRNANGTEGSIISTHTTTNTNHITGSFINLSAGNYIIKFNTSNGGYSAARNLYSTSFNYSTNTSISPYQNPNVSLTSINCDPTNQTSIISAQITSGRFIYPLTMSLFNQSDVSFNNPIQVVNINSPAKETTFTAVPNGQYTVRTSSTCYTSIDHITVSNATSAPNAMATSPVCTSHPGTTLGLNVAPDLFDITWFTVNPDHSETLFGTGSPLNTNTLSTTNYKAKYSLKPSLGCQNTTLYEAVVTVNVTNDPNAQLSVSDIELCLNNAPQVIIGNTQNNFIYEIVDGSGQSYNPKVTGIGHNGNLAISIPAHVQLVGGSTLKVTSTNGNQACKSVMNDVIQISQSTPNTTLTVNGSSICRGIDGTITIMNAESGVTYTVLKNGLSLNPSLSSVGNGSHLVFTIPSSNLTAGSNEYTIQVSRPGCATGVMVSKAIILVNQPPITLSLVNAVCGNSGRKGSFTVSTPGGSHSMEYSLDNVIFSSNNSFTQLNPGSYILYAKDMIKGCSTQTTIQIKENCLQLTKTASSNVYSAVGNVITYTFKVKNTGPDRAFDIQVTDLLPGLSSISPASVSSLNPDASVEFTATYTITQADINRGTLTNTATANARTADNIYYSATASATITSNISLPATGLLLTGQ